MRALVGVRLAVLGLAIALMACGSSHRYSKGDPTDFGQRQKDLLPSGAIINWDLMRTQVLNTCVNCHGGTRAKKPLLETYEEVRSSISDVWKEIDQEKMPPRRSGLPLISGCKKAALNIWIAEGVPQEGADHVSQIAECAP